MGLRDSLKNTVRSVLNKLSGEYSAGAAEIRDPPPESTPVAGGDVKITRARLKRPRDAAEESGKG